MYSAEAEKAKTRESFPDTGDNLNKTVVFCNTSSCPHAPQILLKKECFLVRENAIDLFCWKLGKMDGEGQDVSQHPHNFFSIA